MVSFGGNIVIIVVIFIVIFPDVNGTQAIEGKGGLTLNTSMDVERVFILNYIKGKL